MKMALSYNGKRSFKIFLDPEGDLDHHRNRIIFLCHCKQITNININE